MLWGSLEENGQVAVVNLLLRGRFPIGTVSAGRACVLRGGSWASSQSVGMNPCELSVFF